MDMDMGSGSDSGSMPMNSTSDMASMGMAMTFFTSTTTPLWSTAFAPTSTGQYAGVCIFLIAFATVFRLLVAVRVNVFHSMGVAEKTPAAGHHLLGPTGKDVHEAFGDDRQAQPRPWRAKNAVLLGAADVVIAGVSYLLMLAVMTMNVGYFMSVLGGVFLGTVICGHRTGSATGH